MDRIAGLLIISLWSTNCNVKFMPNKSFFCMQRLDFLYDTSSWRLLRIPFSLYLLPVYVLGLFPVPHINWMVYFQSALIVHLIIYPASNIYNSCMDRDKGPIGGLLSPPEVNEKTMKLSVLFDMAGLIFSFLLSPVFCLLCLIYTMVSKAYSWRRIRLKKFGLVSFIVVSLFQGGLTYYISNLAASGDFLSMMNFRIDPLPIMFSTLLVAGFYPLSQVFQHQEDSDRGDRTISIMLGVKGTFRFSLLIFLSALLTGLVWLDSISQDMVTGYILTAGFFPPTLYFLYLMLSVERHNLIPGFREIKILNDISSLSLLISFAWILSLL